MIEISKEQLKEYELIKNNCKNAYKYMSFGRVMDPTEKFDFLYKLAEDELIPKDIAREKIIENYNKIIQISSKEELEEIIYELI